MTKRLWVKRLWVKRLWVNRLWVRNYVLESVPHSKLHSIPFGFSLPLFIFAALATFIARFECFDRINTHSLSGTLGDGGIYLWLLSVVPQALDPENWYNVPAFYPYGQALAWSDNYILPSLLLMLLRSFSTLALPVQSLIVAHNGLLLGATALTGWCVSRLTFRLTGSLLPSCYSCLAVIFCHFFIEHLGHPQLQYGFFLPLSAEVALLITSASTSKSDKKATKILRAVLLGIVVGCAFLTAVYYGIFSASIAIIILLCWLATAFSRRCIAELTYLVFGGILGFSPFIPFLLPYFATEATFGQRNLYEAYYFSAHLLSYLSAGPLHTYSGILGKSTWSHSEAHLSLGIISPILLLWGAVSTNYLHKYKIGITVCFASLMLALATNIHGLGIPSLKVASAFLAWIALTSGVFVFIQSQKLTNSNSIHLGALTLVILTSIIFSLGPLGNPVKGELALGPFAVAHQFIPGMGGIRAVSRWGVVVLIFLPVIAAVLAHRAYKQIALAKTYKRAFFQYFFWLSFMILVFLEQYTTGYGKGMEELPKIPPVVHSMTRSEKNSGAIIFLPMSHPLSSTGEILSWSDFIRRNITAMNASVHLNMPTVNGYSGVKTKIMRDLPRRTRLFPDERSCTALQEISGLKFVVWEQHNKLVIPKSLPSCLSYLGHDDTGYHLFKIKDEVPLNGERTVIASPTSTSILLQFSGCNAVTIQESINKNVISTSDLNLVGHATKRVICPSKITSTKMAPRYWQIKPSSSKPENTCFFSVTKAPSVPYSIDEIAGRCFLD